jgi:hypothetical protein
MTVISVDREAPPALPRCLVETVGDRLSVLVESLLLAWPWRQEERLLEARRTRVELGCLEGSTESQSARSMAELVAYLSWKAACLEQPFMLDAFLAAAPEDLAFRAVAAAEAARRPVAAEIRSGSLLAEAGVACSCCGHAFAVDERAVVLAWRSDIYEPVVVCRSCVDELVSGL